MKANKRFHNLHWNVKYNSHCGSTYKSPIIVDVPEHVLFKWMVEEMSTDLLDSVLRSRKRREQPEGRPIKWRPKFSI